LKLKYGERFQLNFNLRHCTEFLFPALSTCDTLSRRLTEGGLAWSGRQAPPDALVGVLFLLQVCNNVKAPNLITTDR
jgi:hypothetical protein